MIVTPIKTTKVTPGSPGIFELLDQSLNVLEEGTVVAITSKVVALCDNHVVPINSASKDVLSEEESDYYLTASFSKFGYHFTIKNNTLTSSAGIDKSNGNGTFVLWPKDAQKSANEIRKYLAQRFGVKNVGVVITDSTSVPLRRGTVGQLIAHSGFKALNDYVGKPDLFGRPFLISQANVASGLAGAAVTVMGEGTEQTPICIISDLPFVQFQPRDPSRPELAELHVPLEQDLFAPFLMNAPWQRGQGGVS